MTKGCIITGTDTGVGKTVFAAMLTLALKGVYWKPVQAGTEGATDTQTVRKLTGLPDNRFLPESYILTQPLSPHRAAELDGRKIEELKLPKAVSPLIIEGAGGLMVPLSRETLFIDIFKKWNLPVILCARTVLGTINHTLLSIEAMKKRAMPILGIAFIGSDNPDNIRTITEFSGVRNLGRLPLLEALGKKSLEEAFDENFRKEDFDFV
ncbi:MAG: dethiobiotin synthase [Pseudomonadota bacterium]